MNFLTNIAASTSDRLVIKHRHLAVLLFLLVLISSAGVYAHEGHLSDKPWAACETQELGDLCSYNNDDGDGYHGTCRAVSEHLICVRNKPIVKASEKLTESSQEKSQPEEQPHTHP